MASLPSQRTVPPPYSPGQTIGGKPVYSPVRLGPEYIPTASMYPTGFTPQNSYVAWIMRVAEGMASNILHNWQNAGGKPAGWDENKYGSWSALVARNAGSPAMNAGDLSMIVDFLMNDYNPSPNDWYQSNFGAMPSPSPTEWVLDPSYITLAMAQQEAKDKSELERQFKIYQAEAEIAAAKAKAMSGGSSGPRYSSYTRAGGGGGGGGGADGCNTCLDPNVMAKLDMDWKIALLQMEGDLARMELTERLALWEIEAKERMQQAELQYMRERDLQNTWTERGALVARTMANPNDALQREYMLRMYNNMVEGQEPKGTPIDIFSGQAMNSGAPTSFTEIQEQNAATWGMNAVTPGNPPIATAPVPGPSTNPYPPSGYASGTSSVPSLSELIRRWAARMNQGQQGGSGEEQQQEYEDWRQNPKYSWYLMHSGSNSWMANIVRKRPSFSGYNPIEEARKKFAGNRIVQEFVPPHKAVMDAMQWGMRPGFASGTADKEGEFGSTREKFFIVGDSESGVPTGNEELIINHDQGRVTVVPNKYLSYAVKAIANGGVKYAS